MTEFFDDPKQLEELVDLIISGELPLKELNDLIAGFLGLGNNCDDEGDGSKKINPEDIKIVDALFGDGAVCLQVVDDQNLLPPNASADKLLTSSNALANPENLIESNSMIGHAFPLTPQQQDILRHISTTNSATSVKQWSCLLSIAKSTAINPYKEGIGSDSDEDSQDQHLGGASFPSCHCSEVSSVSAYVNKVWKDLIKRHPAVQTLFLKQTTKKGLRNLELSSNVVWQVRPNRLLPFSAREIDWKDKPDQELEAEWNKFVEEDIRAGFDTFKLSYLFRVHIIYLPNSKMRMLWSFHAALLDNFSAALVANELASILEGREMAVLGQNSLTQESLSDNTTRERDDKNEANNEKNSKHFWREYLKDIMAPTPLLKCKPSKDKGRQKTISVLNFSIKIFALFLSANRN